jgi:hypothetical protein
MASKLPKVVKKYAKAFDKLRKKTDLEGIHYVLLKNEGMSGNLVKIAEIYGCDREYDDYRMQTNIRWATMSDEDQANLFQASDIGIGVDSLLVYSIEKESMAAPDLKRPWWDIYCTMRDGIIRYQSLEPDLGPPIEPPGQPDDSFGNFGPPPEGNIEVGEIQP